MARDRLTGISILDPDYRNIPILPASIAAAWSGRIARLRVYSDGRVFVYKDPGHNSDQVGVTSDPNLIHTLFLARDNGSVISGYTRDDGTIGFIDY